VLKTRWTRRFSELDERTLKEGYRPDDTEDPGGGTGDEAI
jgi:hypothetical protein